MPRKLFLNEFEVLKIKRKHCGVELTPYSVLVKLREPSHTPVWRRLDYGEFCRERRFRERRTSLQE